MRRIERLASPLDPDFLIRKHYPGGQDHDQSNHGGGGGGSGSGGSGQTSEEQVKVPEGRKWIEHKEGLPRDTEQHYKQGGDYTPERKKLHQEIIEKYVKGVEPVPADKKPVALIMMGGSGSGKSTLDKGINEKDFVHVDPDAVKGDIPEYREAVEASAKDAAFMVHEESGTLAKEIREHAITNRKNLLLDGTGKNLKDYTETVTRLRNLGYEVTVMMPDIDVETAVSRVKRRAEKTGRLVPEAVVREIYSKVPQNFEPIARLANNFALFDNRGAKPRLVWSKKGDSETIHDQEFVRQFRSKK